MCLESCLLRSGKWDSDGPLIPSARVPWSQLERNPRCRCRRACRCCSPCLSPQTCEWTETTWTTNWELIDLENYRAWKSFRWMIDTGYPSLADTNKPALRIAATTATDQIAVNLISDHLLLWRRFTNYCHWDWIGTVSAWDWLNDSLIRINQVEGDYTLTMWGIELNDTWVWGD